MRDGGPSLQTDHRSQSTTIGIVLILGITLLGTGLVVGYGTQAIGDTERVTTLSKVEHSLTQFDSQAAIVALGESSVQRVDLGDARDGTFSADGDAGWMRVVHRNATGNGNDTELYNASMGTVRYRNGATSIAYQGGGVWRRTGNGSTMLSQPEFNYRGGTLTLPAIRIVNDASASGETTAFLRGGEDSSQVYPNASESYSDGRNYTNPVMKGSVAVTVKSQFYEGWADFFRGRTAGNVSVDHSARTATVELLTLDTVGEFVFADALESAGGLDARGQAAGHSLTDFSVEVENGGGNGNGNAFNNHYLSFYSETDGHRFEYVVHTPSGCKNGVDGETLVVKAFYRNTNTGEQHEWSNSSVPADSGPIRLDCTDGATLVVDVTSSQPMTYGDTNSDGTNYDWSGSPTAEANFSHSDDGEPLPFTDGDQAASRLLARHYVALLGDDFTLNARSGTGKNSNGKGAKIDYAASGGTFDYESDGDSYITYLHISENNVTVEMQ